MNEDIKEQLDRIEQYAQLAAKSVLNVKEASIILGTSEQTVRRMVRERDIPAYKPNVNRLYFKKNDLENWMLQNRSKSKAELESEAIIYCYTHQK